MKKELEEYLDSLGDIEWPTKMKYRNETNEEFRARLTHDIYVWPKPHGLTETELAAFVTGENGNVNLLATLLRNDSRRDDVPIDVREKLHHLPDFLERKFRGTQGKNRTPSYEWSPGLKHLMVAHWNMRMHMHMHFMGWTISEAAKAVAKENNNVTAKALELFHSGKYEQFNIQSERKFRP
jgi:hypothetical protein